MPPPPWIQVTGGREPVDAAFHNVEQRPRPPDLAGCPAAQLTVASTPYTRDPAVPKRATASRTAWSVTGDTDLV